MARENKITCTNNFKNSDPAIRKQEFNKKMAALIRRAEEPAPAGKAVECGPASVLE